jgi:hypothetical protein
MFLTTHVLVSIPVHVSDTAIAENKERDYQTVAIVESVIIV